MYYLYLLKCNDNSYYVGVTNNLNRRLLEHSDGIDKFCYTYTRRPVGLEHYLEYQYIEDAIAMEKRLKKWTRAKKKAFFQKKWNELHELAKCRNKSSHEGFRKKV